MVTNSTYFFSQQKLSNRIPSSINKPNGYISSYSYKKYLRAKKKKEYLRKDIILNVCQVEDM